MGKWPSVQQPKPDLIALCTCVEQLKEIVEILTGQRPNTDSMAVDPQFAAITKQLEDIKARLKAGGL